jgi:hypothetical protein
VAEPNRPEAEKVAAFEWGMEQFFKDKGISSTAVAQRIRKESPVASNYLLFSEEIETESEEAAKWVEQQLHAADSSEDGGICSYERDGSKVWVYSEEYADVSRLEGILAEYQKKFGDQKAIVLSWAFTCSKPRLSEFGGGASVIVAGKVKNIDARDWAETLARQLVPGHGKEDKA